MFKNYSLRVKLAAPIVLVAFLVLTAMTGFMAFKNWGEAKSAASEKTQAMAEAAANNILSDLMRDLGVVRTLATSLVSFKNQKMLDREFVSNVQLDLLKNNKKVIGVWSAWEPNEWDHKDEQFINGKYTDASGRFISYASMENETYTLSPLLGYDKEGEGDYYLVPKKRGIETIIEPYLYKLGGVDVTMTSLVEPIYIDNKFVGAAGVDISLAQVKAEVDKIKPYQNSISYLLSENNFFISHPDIGLITKPVSDDENSKNILDVLKNNQISNIELKDSNNDSYLYTSIPIRIGETKQFWTLVVKNPMSEVLADAKGILMVQLIISLIGIALLIVAIILLANNLTSILNKIISGLKEESNVVTSSSQEVANASIKISEATTQQAASLQETVSSIEEITAMVAKNAANASSSVESSNRSSEAAQRGKMKTEVMLESIEAIAHTNEITVSNMQKLNQEFEEIVAIIHNIASKTQVINEIVFQTKLLSFNASVEAARAGESGKGFSVVAEEIGSLAQMSGTAASEIAELLSASVTKVTKTVEESKNVMSKMISESKQKVDMGKTTSIECAQVIQEIVGHITNVNVMIKEISTASKEQSIGIEEINKAMIELDEATHSSSTVSVKSAETAKELMGQAVRLNELVEELNQLASGHH